MEHNVNKHHRYGQPIPEPHPNDHQLWISGQDFASSAELLAKHSIVAVCSVGTDPFELPQHILRLQLEAEDTLDQDITSHFEPVFEFIEKSRK